MITKFKTNNGEFVSGYIVNNYQINLENDNHQDNREAIEKALVLLFNKFVFEKEYKITRIIHYDDNEQFIDSDIVGEYI